MSVQIIKGDCLEVLQGMADESVHCCITSPPYWGLRSYGGEEGMIGLEATLDEHIENMVAVFREVRRVLRSDGTCWMNYGDCYASSPNGQSVADKKLTSNDDRTFRDKPMNTIQGAFKPKDLMMLPARVAIALQEDGWWLRSEIVWAKKSCMPESVTDRPTSSHEKVFLFAKGQWKGRSIKFSNLEGKRVHFLENLNLCSPVPALSWPPSRVHEDGVVEICIRLATAILYSAKLNQNFCLSSLDTQIRNQCSSYGDGDFIGRLPIEHRFIAASALFVLSKCTTKDFLCELASLGAILTDSDHLLIGGAYFKISDAPSIYRYTDTSVAINYPGEICEIDLVHGRIITHTPSTCKYFYDADAVRTPQSPTAHGGSVQPKKKPRDGHEGHPGHPDALTGSANLRNVWHLGPEPFPDSHFAVFPQKLVEPCIKAGTSEKGVCGECGAPWVRVTKKELVPTDSASRNYKEAIPEERDMNDGGLNRMRDGHLPGYRNDVTTLGWQPTCECNAGDPVPATVLDPFGGSGTVGLVADKLGRDAVLIEINEDYCEMARKRIEDSAPMFAQVEVVGA